jgi:glycosyltransferase involved in cell wall biosynthesis
MYNILMKIGLNGKCLFEQNPAGPELYTLNIFKALARTDSSNIYIIYFPKEPAADFWAGIANGNNNFSYKVVNSGISWTQLGLALELIKNPVDVFFTTVHTLPIIHLPSLKIVGMIHGLEQDFNKYDNWLSKLLKGKHEWYVAKFSNTLVVPSQHTKKAILDKNWKVTEQKIVVIPEGVSKEFYRRTDSEIENIRRKYQLGSDPYFLFVSTIQPRKNLPKLVEAFSGIVKDPEFSDVKLVIAGKQGWMFEESLEAPSKYRVKENVKFLGRVPQEDLPALLSGAVSLVNPSLEEGFGLPVLEAMASKVPVLVSNIEAFREVGDNTLVYFDQTDKNDIKAKMLGVLRNELDTVDLTCRALERSKNFTWAEGARKLVGIFERAYYEKSN